MRKEELAEAMSHVLRGKGVDSQLVMEEAGTDFLGGKKTEICLHLEGQEIDSIWVNDYHRGGGVNSSRTDYLRCCYRVLLDRPPTEESEDALHAYSRVIRERKILRTLLTLGIKKGKVLEVRWTGGRVAESLNHDENVSRMVADNAEFGFLDGNIEVAPVGGERLADIFSPGLMDVWHCPRRGDEDHFKHLLEEGEMEDFPGFSDFFDLLDSVLPYELYAKIAEHVRRTPIVS
jgi:hypothetical protein